MANNARTFVVVAASDVGDDRLQWIEVMPTADKARNGPYYFTVTRDDLDVYASFIREHGDRIPIDYDHEGAEGGSTVAAGWFTGEAEVDDTDRGPVLRAQVEWTPQGLEDVQTKRFRFISPEFDFSDRDAKTGLMTKAKDLIAATLTNRPFFKELAAVASDLPEEEIAALADALGVEPDAVVRAAQWTTAYMNNLPDSSFLYVEPGGSKDSDGKTEPRSLRHFPVKDADGTIDMPHLRNALSRIPQSDVPADVKERLTNEAQRMLDDHQGGSASATTEGDDMDLSVFAAALGLSDDATEEQIVAAAKAAKDRADAARGLQRGSATLTAELIAALDLPADADEADVLAATRRTATAANRLGELEPEVEQLRTRAATATKLEGRVKALEAERRMDRVDSILADGVRTGRVVPAEKKALAKQFADNPDGLAELISARPEHMFALNARGSNVDLEEGDDIVSVRAKFDSDEADGVDTESARLHVRAEQILREQGKSIYTDTEYEKALALASESR